jgi:hypothetical protein
MLQVLYAVYASKQSLYNKFMIPYAIIYMFVNGIALLGVLPWILQRKRAGLGLRVADTTRLPRAKSQPRADEMVRGALFGTLYIFLGIIALFAGGGGLAIMAQAVSGDTSTTDVVTAELLVVGAAIGLFACYCLTQIAKEDPSFGRDGGG